MFPAGPGTEGTAYLSPAPQAVPQAAGFSVGLSPAPQAVPQAAGFSVGLSPAPQAVPQVAAGAVCISLRHPYRLERAIVYTSLGVWGLAARLGVQAFSRLHLYCKTPAGKTEVRTNLLLSYLKVTGLDKRRKRALYYEKTGLDSVRNCGGLRTVGALRKALVEELADVLMYYNDVLLCYGITAEELKQSYTEKFHKNMTRW